jgi:hypothetical protein
MISKLGVLAIVLALWAPRVCCAWGDEGHKVNASHHEASFRLPPRLIR